MKSNLVQTYTVEVKPYHLWETIGMLERRDCLVVDYVITAKVARVTFEKLATYPLSKSF